MFVCLYLIQILISEPISTKLCTHLPHGLEENVGYVRTHIFLFFDLFHLLCRERVPITGKKMAAECRLQDRRWLPVQVIRDGVISVILTGLCATSRKRRRSRRQFRVLTATVLQLG